MVTITPEIIEREARYNLTRYTPADADTIRAVAVELDMLATIYGGLVLSAQVWLAVNAPDALTIYAKYEVESAVKLAAAIFENSAYSTTTKTGGYEKYPISTWRTWIGKNKRSIAKLQAAFDYAKVDMISQAQNVNWWAQ